MHSLFKGVLIISILFLSHSCTKDKVDITMEECEEVITYNTGIKEIIETNCAYSNCHDGSGAAPGNYTSYFGIEPFLNAAQFEKRALTDRDMPPTYATGPKSLSQEDIDMISCWMQNGYVEN